MLNIAIQIVNYNTKKYLINCINGVLNDLKNSNLSYEILVLDNASQDNLKDLEENYQSKKVKFFYTDKNKGFGAGHNLLAQKSKSDYILILNPDIKFIEKNTTERLLNGLRENTKYKVSGPKLITAEKQSQPWDHGEITGLWAWFMSKTGRSFWKERNNLTKSTWVAGTFFLIERNIFEKINGFDEKFFLYKEEEDLCLRIRKLGFDIIYNPKIKVLHYGSVVASKGKFMQKSNRYFIDKHLMVK